MEPRGEMTFEELYEIYSEQAKALVEAGVDLFTVETMLGVDETSVALDAIQAVCDLPIICTLSVEADGSAYYNGNAVEAVETLQDMGSFRCGCELFGGTGSADGCHRFHEAGGRGACCGKTQRRHALYHGNRRGCL